MGVPEKLTCTQMQQLLESLQITLAECRHLILGVQTPKWVFIIQAWLSHQAKVVEQLSAALQIFGK